MKDCPCDGDKRYCPYEISNCYKNCGIDEEYTPSSTYGDYSPSNPWGAPGMSIKDFI